jgi:ABC-2 type transport system permease protein
MKKIWLIAVHTYLPRVKSGTFLLLTFGLPMLMIIAGAISIISMTRGELPDVVGYIDQSGILTPVSEVTLENQELLQFMKFESVEKAIAAMNSGEIGGFLVVPQGYPQGKPVVYHSLENPNSQVESGLEAFLWKSALPNQPQWIYERLRDPSEITMIDRSNGARVTEGAGLLVYFATPAVLAVMLILALFFTSNQMGVVMIREKEQRSMEMLITSLRTRELVSGKVLGITLLSLTQIAIWGLGAIIALVLATYGRVELSQLTIPWSAVFWAFLLGIPGYFLYAVIAAGLGIIAGENQQARQLAGLLGIISMVPIWFLSVIINNPSGTEAIGLSLFPLTGPMVILLRMIFTNVPAWQLWSALGIMLLGLLVSLWLASKIFRAAMLMYGQALRPRQIWQALRGV